MQVTIQRSIGVRNSVSINFIDKNSNVDIGLRKIKFGRKRAKSVDFGSWEHFIDQLDDP